MDNDIVSLILICNIHRALIVSLVVTSVTTAQKFEFQLEFYKDIHLFKKKICLQVCHQLLMAEGQMS